MKKRALVLTGGGDCPGLNAVIRGIVYRADQEEQWEILGSIQSFNGMLWDPMEYMLLDRRAVSGIHIKGGTIIETVNKGGPFEWPIQKNDGSWVYEDRSDEMLRNIKRLGIDAVISIGGDGSQKISQKLYEKGLNIIGVPKTIDNDLYATDFTFGFQTAVEIATDAIDKLVTTAASHNRVMVLEVMGRDAGWIALHAAIAGGADICLIPEVNFDIEKIAKSIDDRFKKERGFAIIIVAEGAKSKAGEVVAKESDEAGYHNRVLGGVGMRIVSELKALGMKHDFRTTVLGHLQRGGTPCAYDRVLATEYGVKSFEMVLEEKFGEMVVYNHPILTSVPITEAISKYNVIEPETDALVKVARGTGISFGD